MLKICSDLGHDNPASKLLPNRALADHAQNESGISSRPATFSGLCCNHPSKNRIDMPACMLNGGVQLHLESLNGHCWVLLMPQRAAGRSKPSLPWQACTACAVHLNCDTQQGKGAHLSLPRSDSRQPLGSLTQMPAGASETRKLPLCQKTASRSKKAVFCREA